MLLTCENFRDNLVKVIGDRRWAEASAKSIHTQFRDELDAQHPPSIESLIRVAATIWQLMIRELEVKEGKSKRYHWEAALEKSVEFLRKANLKVLARKVPKIDTIWPEWMPQLQPPGGSPVPLAETLQTEILNFACETLRNCVVSILFVTTDFQLQCVAKKFLASVLIDYVPTLRSGLLKISEKKKKYDAIFVAEGKYKALPEIDIFGFLQQVRSLPIETFSTMLVVVAGTLYADFENQVSASGAKFINAHNWSDRDSKRVLGSFHDLLTEIR